MKNKLKIIAVLQSRMGSSRLPNKALLKLNGKPAISRMVDRIKEAKTVKEIWLATGKSKINNKLENFFSNTKIKVFRGDDDDVLSRFVEISKIAKADIIIRLTGDCPLIDPKIIDETVELLINRKADYASNILKRKFPDGLDVEVFTKKTLLETGEFAEAGFSREHVTTYMHGLHKNKYRKGVFKKASLEYASDFSHLRWTLDEEKDHIFLDKIYKNLPANASWQDIVSYLIKHPLLQLNNNIVAPNEGARDLSALNFDKYKISNSYFERSIKTVPLGSQTFSKSYIQWPKGVAPLFIDRAQGAKVIDIDGNHYIDYIMGLLPIVLGYCDEDVDQAAISQIMKGTIFSMPSSLETELAEKLVEIIPSAEMVRFGKNGSDATTASIRLARAYTDRDLVAVSGYHGWHDWYISSTSRNLGVPKKVQSLTHKFNFNDADSLHSLFKKFPNKFAAVILEPAGLVKTDVSALKRIRELCTANGVVLIFDEIISGFRINIGGAQKEYGVTPDLSCFGKAMANGYPLSAIVGSKKIMTFMEEIFFSSTFGGENVSLAASLATIKKIEDNKVILKTKNYGDILIKELNNICIKEGVDKYIKISNLNWWPKILIINPPIGEELFVSLLRQEFISAGLLIGSTFNLCFSHRNKGVLELTMKGFRTAIKNIKFFVSSKNPSEYLKGDLIQKTFKVR
jgi:glutamate-1-semialdehyde aminotransferase/spore coat polysaccharide biosynthesis protein SpsF (cytidylyltransferase family)